MEQNFVRNLRVGLFLVFGVAGTVIAVIMLGGGSDAFFADRYKLSAAFEEVGGLRNGATVRLAGIKVGEVSSITFPSDPNEKKIFVHLSLLESYAPRIRSDTKARLENSGMLGDKYISVSVGSPEESQLEHGDWIDTEQSTSIMEYQSRALGLLNNAEQMTGKLNNMLGKDTEADSASASRIMGSVERILAAAEDGEGLLNALVYDRSLANRVRRAVDNLEQSTASIASIAEEIKNGDGLANELIYGEGGAKLTQEVAELSDMLGRVVGDLKNEESLLHALVYDPDRTKIITDIESTIGGLKSVVDSIQSGEGTLGLMATDPTLYEDLRALVGGAQRNKLLRNYIRRTIDKAEDEKAASWKEDGAESPE